MTLFSVRKECGHRVISILGLKIKLRDKSYNPLEDFCQIENLNYLERQGTRFPHPIGIVLHKKTKVGRNCIIYQNVTIGEWNGVVPELGDGVCIYPNSVVVGNVKIGRNAKIAPCSLVRDNIPENAIAAGNPAKIVGYVK